MDDGVESRPDFDFIPLARPNISEDELSRVRSVLESGWLTRGPQTERFENAFARYVGAPAALGLNSCTAALHLALLVSGIGAGDEVITTPMTFTASVNVIEHVGARPVLVDVEPDTLNLDPAMIEARISPATKAVLVVHYAGHPAELDAIHELGQMHSLQVIEDAAHALPAAYKGRSIGSGTNPTAFSFYATKNLTTGEGGMLTGHPNIIEKASILSLHGMTRDAWKRYDRSGDWYYEVVAPGFKYNMTDLQASIGLAQLDRLPSMQAHRENIVALYNEGFRDCDLLETPTVRDHVSSAWHLYVVRLRLQGLSIGRDQFLDELRRWGIGASVHFIPIHVHPYYQQKYGLRPGDFPVAYNNYCRMLSLPLSASTSEAEAARVVDAVTTLLKRFRR